MNCPYLTPPEEHVLVLVACGCTTPEIARHLGRSVHTVKSHLQRAGRRLGAHDSAHLVALVIAHCLIPMDTALRGGLDG